MGDRLRIWKKIPHRPPAARSIRRTPVATTRLNVGSGHEKAGRGYHSLTRPLDRYVEFELAGRDADVAVRGMDAHPSPAARHT